MMTTNTVVPVRRTGSTPSTRPSSAPAHPAPPELADLWATGATTDLCRILAGRGAPTGALRHPFPL
jgi:hypothetical protein